jgi:hypothetical protein
MKKICNDTNVTAQHFKSDMEAVLSVENSACPATQLEDQAGVIYISTN